ncbi:metal-sensing transcriptional repressor [Ruficoccus amylovorans]|uniref:Metal-sensing transcriptional repressor n=1 Tax=Ruficoccus amylovorans TaxID=1804625 RepID=A0A842HGM5_9BACT|nr:metal-sensing transcriptional repressor [Ruficoccus amylovorans]MBC2595459.1 metal-sensing transcriptional repressor [Ruficoccus amylovorans]
MLHDPPTVAACRGALNALTKELLTEHLEHHLISLPETPETARDAAREIQTIITMTITITTCVRPICMSSRMP